VWQRAGMKVEGADDGGGQDRLVHQEERVHVEEQIDPGGGQLAGQRRVAHSGGRPHRQPQAAREVADARRLRIGPAAGQHRVDAVPGLGEGAHDVHAGRLLGNDDDRERASG
jgi:hypothetical protein